MWILARVSLIYVKVVVGIFAVSVQSNYAIAYAEPQIRVRVQSHDPADWLGGRLHHLVIRRLSLLGLRVVSVRSGRLWPDRWGEDEIRAQLNVGAPSTRVEHLGRVPIELKVNDLRPTIVYGDLKSLDALANELVRHIFRGLDQRLPLGWPDILAVLELPWTIQRQAGRAWLREMRRELRKSRLLLGRIVEPSIDTFAARDFLEARDLLFLTSGPSPTLIEAALERREHAQHKKDFLQVFDASLDAVRFGLKPALYWRLDLPSSARVLSIDEQRIWISLGGVRMAIDPIRGQLERYPTWPGRWIGFTNGDSLVLEGTRLYRRTTDNRTRWQRKISPGLLRRVVLSGTGQILIAGSEGLAWVETSQGQLSARRRDIQILDVSEAGAIAREHLASNEKAMFGLIRPGRDAFAWRVAWSKDITEVRITASRVLVKKGQTLYLYDLHSGRLLKPLLSLPSSAKILSAQGRHAVVSLGEHKVALVDVLARSISAQVIGPGQPMAALSSPFEVTVVYATGDVLRWDPDGLLLDRSVVRGRIRNVYALPPTRPGVLVETEGSLYALSNITPNKMRDIDMLLEAARAAYMAGHSAVGLRIVTEMLLTNAGKIVEAEQLRAEVLKNYPVKSLRFMSASATARSSAARDSSQSVAPFSLSANVP